MRLTWLAGCAALSLAGCAQPIATYGPGHGHYAGRPYPAEPPYEDPEPQPGLGVQPPVYGGGPPEEVDPGAPEDDPYGADPGYPGQPYRSRKG